MKTSPLSPCVEPFYYNSDFHVIGISLANYVDAAFLFFHTFVDFTVEYIDAIVHTI